MYTLQKKTSKSSKIVNIKQSVANILTNSNNNEVVISSWIGIDVCGMNGVLKNFGEKMEKSPNHNRAGAWHANITRTSLIEL